MNRMLLCAALSLSLVSTLSAQAQSAQDSSPATPDAPQSVVSADEAKKEAARLLKSAAKSERAWGAYLSGRYELKENIPALVEMLVKEAIEDAPDEESAYGLRVALDALIQLDAEVPADTLRALYARHPDETVVLLSRSPIDNQATLLSLMAETRPNRVRWLALGNLLAQTKAQGFAALLLREMQIKATITLLSSAGEGRGWNGGGGVGGDSLTFCARPEGFPPVGAYLLTHDAPRGSVVVVKGMHTVYYQRKLYLCPGDFNTRPLAGDPELYRQEYLLALLGMNPDDTEFNVEPEFEIVWKNARQYAREVRGLRRKLRQTYTELLQRLQESGLLTADEASLLATPNLTFEIIDFRRDADRPPLPDVGDDVQDDSKIDSSIHK